MEDLKPFESDERVTKKLVTAAIEQRLLGPDSSLLACPSPNCDGVFRRFTFMAYHFYLLIVVLVGWRKATNCRKENLSFAICVVLKFAEGNFQMVAGQ